jgi:hypothetical protein
MEAFSPVAPEPFDPSTLEQPVAPVRGTGGSTRALNLALGVAVLVAASGISFALGRASAPAVAAAPAANVGGANGGGAANGGPDPANGGGNLPGASFNVNGNGGGPGGGGDDNPGAIGGGNGIGRGDMSVQGTVQSVAANGITIALAGGRTVTIGTDGSTTYHAQAPAAASDVTAGKTVIVRLGGAFRPGDTTTNGSGGIRFGTATDVTILP